MFFVIVQLSDDLGEEAGEEEWLGKAAHLLMGYEHVLRDHFKIDANVIAKGDKPLWDYWSSVFYCGTIFTTIGES
jgi:hypothetical protein